MVSMALDAEIDEAESTDESDKIEEIISDIEDECAAVFDNEDNATLINELFDVARTNYEKDRKGWDDFFADLKFELISTDDEDNLREILLHYQRKAKLELS